MDNIYSVKRVSTKDTYEASFYMLYGGELAKVRKILLNDKRAERRGYRQEWTLVINNVPLWAIETWRTRQAYGNITEYVNVRCRLKRDIKRAISNT